LARHNPQLCGKDDLAPSANLPYELSWLKYINWAQCNCAQLPGDLGDMLANLFEVVRRQALRVDDALDQLKSERDKL
jgi:hypothetical protein